MACSTLAARMMLVACPAPEADASMAIGCDVTTMFVRPGRALPMDS